MDLTLSKKQMTLAIKAVVVPELRKLGYSGSFPYFRKEASSIFGFVTFQFNRHGGSFVMEYGRSVDLKSDLADFQKNEPFEKVEARFLPIKNRYRLGATLHPRSTDNWFNYELLTEGSQFEDIAKEVLTLLPFGEDFVKTGNRPE